MASNKSEISLVFSQLTLIDFHSLNCPECYLLTISGLFFFYQIYTKVSKIDKTWTILQNWPKILGNHSNNRKILSVTSKTVYYDILLQEQYGRCSDTVYWAKNSITQHPWSTQTVLISSSTTFPSQFSSSHFNFSIGMKDRIWIE